MRIVAPYRPFAPESAAHRKLGAFDWIETLRMQQASAHRAGIHDCVAISDEQTPLPMPALYYRTHETRLMLWILEVCLCYLESQDFDRDTAMVSPDILVYGDVTRFFEADFGVIVRLREKYVARGHVLLNSVQFWRPQAQDRLVAFYREALTIAKQLPNNAIKWGADTLPLVQLLAPLTEGVHARAGLSVRFIEEQQILGTLDTVAMADLDRGRRPVITLPLVDFKYLRKRRLAEFFEATIGREVLA